MTMNIGMVDRVIRIILGLVLVLAPFVGNLAIYQSTTATVISVVVGLVLLATAAMKFCLLYRILGIRTCEL